MVKYKKTFTLISNLHFFTKWSIFLRKNHINIQVISTSEIKISVLISSEYYELAMRSLHLAFDLDK